MRNNVVEFVRTVVRGIVRMPFINGFIHALAKERDHASVMGIEDRLRRAGFSTLRYGPFEGMRYPAMKHLGYASLPMKFLGTYERELHDVVAQNLSRQYKLVLNIGAADGYYACGYAYKLPQAHIIAWEMVPFIASLLKQLAVENNVAERIQIKGLCTAQELASVNSTGHCLVFSDCEGAEIPLLTHENLQGLESYDLIVECHDHIIPNATAILADRFESTHAIQIIESLPLVMDDVPIPGIDAAGGPTTELYRALEENRLYAMKWIVALDNRKA